MTRVGHQQLTAAKVTGIISYDRTLEYLVMYNNNPVPLYVRLGSPEIPTQRNYDIAVPPNYIMGISVDSNQFGFRLGADNVTLALVSGVTVIEGLIDEPPPALGGVPIQGASLATSDLGGGVRSFAGATMLGIYNLTLWGGLLFNLFPSATTGQGVVQVDVSSDGIAFTSYATYAFWQSIPFTLLMPRIGSFVRVTLNATAIIGEPAIAGSYTLRGTLAEITQLTYTPSSVSIVKNWNIGALGSQQFSFVTVGIPAVNIAGIALAGSGASTVIQALVETSDDLTNWRQVTTRIQSMSIGITLARSMGNLGIFIRITIFEVGGLSGSVGNLYLSVSPAPDIGGILNTIQQALGDNDDPINNNQDIYHCLVHIETWTGQGSVSVASIDTKMTTNNTMLGNINTNTSNTHNDLLAISTQLSTTNSNTSLIATTNSTLSTINTSIGTTNTTLGTTNSSLSTINTSIGTTNTNLTTINTSIGTTNSSLSTINTSIGTTNTNLTTINTSIGTTNTTLATTNSTLSTISSNVATIVSALTRAASGTIASATCGGGIGSFSIAGSVLVAGWYITHLQASVAMASSSTNSLIAVAYGTSVAAQSVIYQTYVATTAVSGGALIGDAPERTYTSLRSAGILVPAANTYIWVSCNSPAFGTIVQVSLTQTS
jgi:hypothetical protein